MDTTANYKFKKPSYTDGADIQSLNDNADTIDSELKKAEDHRIDTNNPHKTTVAQLGLGNVDNTHDTDKSVKYSVSSGTSDFAHYSDHRIGINDFGLRGNFISNAGPYGGSEGDTWDQI